MKHTNWLKWILYIVGTIVGLFVLLIIIGLVIDEPENEVVRPAKGTSFDTPVVIDDIGAIQGMAKAFSHLEAYACLDLGGRIEIKDQGLVEQTDHDYYVFTVTCVNGEEKFYFQIDNLSGAFKEETGIQRDGSSIENALILPVDESLDPLEKHRDGIRLEYVYLDAFACEGKGGIQTTPDGERLWIDQALLEDKGEFYDMMTVHCNNEEDEIYYFYTYFKEMSEYLDSLQDTE